MGVRSKFIPATDTDFGSTVYDDETGRVLGEYVEQLTDGPTDVLDKGEPYGKLGDRWYTRSHAVCEFQRMMWDSTPFWGMRTVWHRQHGSVRQALVRIFDGTLQWINVQNVQPGTL